MTTAELRAKWGDNIAARRNELGLTQAQLAREVGVTEGAIGNYEAGRDEPRTTKKVALAYALGVEPGDLFPWPATSA